LVRLVCAWFLVITIFTLLHAGTVPPSLIDAVAVITTSKLKEQGEKGSYGEIRLYTSIGIGCFSFATGMAIDSLGLVFGILTMWWVGSAVGMGLSFLIVDPPPKKASVEGFDITKSGASQPSREKSFVDVLLEMQTQILLLNLLVQGCLAAFTDSFLYVYLTEVYHVSGSFLGLTTVIAAGSGIPIFYYSDGRFATHTPPIRSWN
jgi:hypothetical protein